MFPSDPTPSPLPPSGSSHLGVNIASSLLSTEELERFKNLLLFAQATVEDFFARQDRALNPDSSSQFPRHKDDVVGNLADRMDWPGPDRTRRLFARGHQGGDDLPVYLLVDTSASMSYVGAKRVPKLHHAARIAASLASLISRQGDKTALGLFADTLKTYLPPGGTRRHLHQIMRALEEVKLSSHPAMAASLHQGALVFKERGQVVVLSDFLADPVTLFDALRQFRSRGFEVLLLQILDPDELELPPHSVAKYIDRESDEEREVNTEELRAAYQTKVRSAIETLAAAADRQGIEHQLGNTALPYTQALEAYLGFRSRAG